MGEWCERVVMGAGSRTLVDKFVGVGWANCVMIIWVVCANRDMHSSKTHTLEFCGCRMSELCHDHRRNVGGW